MSSFYQKALGKAEQSPEKLMTVARSMLDRCRLAGTVFASLSTALIVFDKDGSIVDFNRQAQRFFPALKTRVKSMETVFTLSDLAKFFKETLSGELSYQCRSFSVRREGETPVVLEVLCDPWIEDGKILGMVAQIRDISERESEQKKNDVTERLNSLVSMTAAVAHEIKNPLGAMSLYVDILKKRMNKLSLDDEKLKECSDVLSEEIERLNAVVSSFLMTLRPLDLSSEPVSLSVVAEDVLRLVRYDLEKHRIEAVLKKEDDVPAVIIDVNKMKQVLLNLINNSMHAMPDGGRLTLSLAVRDDRVALSVADTGKGIPERLLPRVFDPYFTTSASGTGLGLTIVYQIMKSHGGDIAVDSEEGRGTVFTLFFPIPQKEISLIPGECSCR